MKLKKPLAALALAVLLCAGAVAGVLAAGQASPAGLIGIANRGVLSEYPENSLAGVEAAASTGIDAVLVDVSLTADGVPAVIEAQSAARMLAGAEEAAVSAYTLAELQAFPLRDRQGGAHNPATENRVCALEELLGAVSVPLVLRFEAGALGAVRAAIDAQGAADRVILFLIGKKRTVHDAVREAAGSYAVMTELRSNIVFELTSWARETAGAGAWAVNLKTTNRYGVAYYLSVLRRVTAGQRAVADVTDPETCGAREDTVKWWDDLIGRGYSVIVTDHPADLVSYKADCAAAREKLRQAYAAATEGFTPPAFGREALNDWKKNYDDALREAESLLANETAALQQLNDARTRLDFAVKAIDRDYEALADGSAGVTVTAPRILLCVLAAAAVTTVQIYFYKKRKKAR